MPRRKQWKSCLPTACASGGSLSLAVIESQGSLPFDRDACDQTGPPALRHPSALPAFPAHPALVFVRHPRARRYLLHVRDDGSVRVTIPRGGSKREAAAFVEAEQGWICRQRE